MRIGAFMPGYAPTPIGAWLATHGWLRELAARGHEVRVAPLTGRRPGYTLDGVRVESSLQGTQQAHAVAGWADVLLSPADGNELTARIAAGTPHVRMVHGPGSMQFTDADLIIANSESTAKMVTGTVPVVICRPITRAADHRVEKTGDRVTLINLTAQKGAHIWSACAKALPDHQFLGVHGGWGRRVACGGRNILVIDPQSDMRAVWAQTRILLMPSESETWGMVGVEAMASGIPVIASNNPGSRESLGDAGIFVNRSNIPDWVEAVRQLDDPATYAVASARARARAAELDSDSDLDRLAAALEVLVAD